MAVESVCLRWRPRAQCATPASHHGSPTTPHLGRSPEAKSWLSTGRQPLHPTRHSQHDLLNTICLSSPEVEIVLQHSYFNLYDSPRTANRLAADPRISLRPACNERSSPRPIIRGGLFLASDTSNSAFPDPRSRFAKFLIIHRRIVWSHRLSLVDKPLIDRPSVFTVHVCLLWSTDSTSQMSGLGG